MVCRTGAIVAYLDDERIECVVAKGKNAVLVRAPEEAIMEARLIRSAGRPSTGISTGGIRRRRGRSPHARSSKPNLCSIRGGRRRTTRASSSRTSARRPWPYTHVYCARGDIENRIKEDHGRDSHLTRHE